MPTYNVHVLAVVRVEVQVTAADEERAIAKARQQVDLRALRMHNRPDLLARHDGAYAAYLVETATRRAASGKQCAGQAMMLIDAEHLEHIDRLVADRAPLWDAGRRLEVPPPEKANGHTGT